MFQSRPLSSLFKDSSETMKIYALRIFVDGWDAACGFYENKLGLARTFHNSDMGWAEFDVGGCSLGIERVSGDDHENQALIGRFVGISLQVENMDDTFADLTAKGVEFTAPPEKQPWGGTIAHFKDPAGNTLTLLS
jgi:predicted enzyme related to lactoylglutathione lyase